MEGLSSYIISISAAAILCAIVHELIGNKGTLSSLIRLLTGLFMTVTVVSPLIKVDLTDFSLYTDLIRADGQSFVLDGENAASTAAAGIIKTETEAYILDKAETLGLNLEVKIVLRDEQPLIPCRVYLKGNASPYARAQLTAYIEDQLGIAQEEQHWSG